MLSTTSCSVHVCDWNVKAIRNITYISLPDAFGTVATNALCKTAAVTFLMKHDETRSFKEYMNVHHGRFFNQNIPILWAHGLA